MAFWSGRLKDGGAERMMRSLDFGHQQLYLPIVAKFGIDLLRKDDIVEFGCGPCGLAPWFQRAHRVGVEPLAEDFRQYGIDYERLGFTQVFHRTAQDFSTLNLRFALAISCNALDHDPEPGKMLEAVADSAMSMFLCYDLRHTQTALHPGVIPVAGLHPGEGWTLKQSEVISMAPWPAMAAEVHGRMCQLWERI